jgi:hypothetical protein
MARGQDGPRLDRGGARGAAPFVSSTSSAGGTLPRMRRKLATAFVATTSAWGLGCNPPEPAGNPPPPDPTIHSANPPQLEIGGPTDTNTGAGTDTGAGTGTGTGAPTGDGPLNPRDAEGASSSSPTTTTRVREPAVSPVEGRGATTARHRASVEGHAVPARDVERRLQGVSNRRHQPQGHRVRVHGVRQPAPRDADRVPLIARFV